MHQINTDRKITLMEFNWDHPENCIYYLMSRVTLSVTSILKKKFIQAKMAHVKPAYLGVLLSLWNNDGSKVVDLGRSAGLEPSTMTGLLDRMERDGLVSRMADPNDRRAQRIVLTQTGRDVQQPIRRIVEITLESVFEGIDDEEISKTSDFFRRVLTNVHKGNKQ